MNVFDFDDYKSYLRAVVSESERGAVSQLAKAAGCDRTYFSQVLNGDVHLTPDHILCLAESLPLSEAQRAFLLLLCLRDRAANPQAKVLLTRQLTKLLRENLLLTKQVREAEATTDITEMQKAAYYATWLPAAVHALTSLPDHDTAAKIAPRLAADAGLVARTLDSLVTMRLVKKVGGSFRHAGGNVFVASDSPFVTNHHVNFRARTIAILTGFGASLNDDVHYSANFSISKKDWPAVKQQALSFIDSHRKKTHASGSEEAYTISLDMGELR